jgi:ubiquinone/menaquinone biosynthesis C-methylase UbiE
MATSKQWQLAQDAAERYERIVVPAILGPAARSLVEWSDLRDGERVVDIGCGTGAATQFAAEKVGASGRVAGVDVNAGMIDVAKSVPPVQGAVIEWFQNSAYQLPFTEGEFDVALCAQTLQFLEDRPRALTEMHRILKPGGRIAVSLWSDIQKSPYFHAMVQAITKNIGAETAAGLRAAFGLSDSKNHPCPADGSQVQECESVREGTPSRVAEARRLRATARKRDSDVDWLLRSIGRGSTSGCSRRIETAGTVRDGPRDPGTV